MSAGFGDRLRMGPALVAPGCHDALSALLAERAGFPALYLSAAAVSRSLLAKPDVGLLGMDELAQVTLRIRERVSLPIVVDVECADGAQARRTVRLLERAGAAAIQIGDRLLPRRSGRLDAVRVVDPAAMVARLLAAGDARRDEETLIIARTDAARSEEIARVLDRAEAYVEAGAHALYVHAPGGAQDMAAIAARFAGRVPLVAAIGGDGPFADAMTLTRLGFNLVTVPDALQAACAQTTEHVLACLARTGCVEHPTPALDPVLGLAELVRRGERYDPVLRLAALRSKAH